jgi:hypothetical protein
MRMLKIDQGGIDRGMVKARLWMEEDGVHGEVTNDSPYPLGQCLFLGNFGYCFVEDLLPGQTVPFALLLPKEPVDYNTDGWAQPGVMYTSLDINQLSRGSQGFISMDNYFYEFLNAIRSGRNDDGSIDYSNQGQRINNSLLDLFAGADSFYAEAGTGHFIATTDGAEKLAFTLNGQPLSRTGQVAIISAHVEMEPVGSTGVVYYHEDMILPELMTDQGDALPTPSDQITQFAQMDVDVGNPLALRFVLPNYGDYRIDELAIWGYAYGVEPLMHLYNHQTDAWDPVPTLTIMMTGKEWQPYIDEDGSIYVRYLPGQGAGRYDTMPLPSIALKGEVE